MNIHWINPLAYSDDETKELFPIIEIAPVVNLDGDLVTMWKRGCVDVPAVRIGGLLHWILKNDGYKARRHGGQS